MGSGGYLALAVLIVLLIPIVAMPLDGRRLPNAIYAVMAICGLILNTWSGGWAGLVGAVASSLGIMIAAGVAITLLRRKMRLRVLTGGQIKLLGAGAAWLGPLGTLSMAVIFIVMLFIVAMWRQIRESQGGSVSATVIVISIMVVALQQNFAV